MPSSTRSSRKREKVIKFLVNLKHSTDPPFDGLLSDVIIPVMGPTGVGKSSFINSLLKSVGGTQPGVEVGHGLQSCTSHLKPVVIPFAHGENGETLNGFTNPNGHNVEGRLVLVDTPGFDDTYEEDSEILRRISVWLGISYVAGMKLGGVIYLHDITQTRMLGTTRRNLTMFRKLVGDNALKCVFLGTTKWGLVDPEAGAKRQAQLEAVFWKDLIDAGAQVFSIYDQDTPEVGGVHDQGAPEDDRSVHDRGSHEVGSIDDQKIPQVDNAHNPQPDAPSPDLGRGHDQDGSEAVRIDKGPSDAGSIHGQATPHASSNHDQTTLLTPTSVDDQNTPEGVSVNRDVTKAGSIHNQSTSWVVIDDQDASTPITVHNQTPSGVASVDQSADLGAPNVDHNHDQETPLKADGTPEGVSVEQDAPDDGSVHDQDAALAASTHSHRRTPRDMVNGILTVQVTHSKKEFLLTIQRELVMKRMSIPQTEAGQTLKYSLDQLIALQKRKVKNLSDEEFAQGREELDRLLKSVKELQVPLAARITAPIKRLFSRVSRL